MPERLLAPCRRGSWPRENRRMLLRWPMRFDDMCWRFMHHVPEVRPHAVNHERMAPSSANVPVGASCHRCPLVVSAPSDGPWNPPESRPGTAILACVMRRQGCDARSSFTLLAGNLACSHLRLKGPFCPVLKRQAGGPWQQVEHFLAYVTHSRLTRRRGLSTRRMLVQPGFLS